MITWTRVSSAIVVVNVIADFDSAAAELGDAFGGLEPREERKDDAVVVVHPSWLMSSG